MRACFAGLLCITLIGCGLKGVPIEEMTEQIKLPREGCEKFRSECGFDVTVNNQLVVPFDSSAVLRRLAPYLKDWQRTDLRETKWQVVSPQGGQTPKFKIRANRYTPGYFGDETISAEVEILPLGDQSRSSGAAAGRSTGVTINQDGDSATSAVAQRNFLPPGEYVVVVEARSSRSWDRKKIYLLIQ